MKAPVEKIDSIYHQIFLLAPQPMWVYDLETLAFLDVNLAAIRHYGYSAAEFLNMTIRDIRPKEDMEELEHALVKARAEKLFFFQGVFRHLKKSGEIIHVEVHSNYILFGDRKAEVIAIHDVSEKLRYLEALDQKRRQLENIAYEQSHLVRAPLARVMALCHRLAFDGLAMEEREMLLDELKKSSKEMDESIRSIVLQTTER